MLYFTIKKTVFYTILAILTILMTTQTTSPLAFHVNSFNQTNISQSNNSDWEIKIAPDNETGEPMIVMGIVYSSDGKTPLEGIKIHVYQTDAKGIYSPDGNRANSRIQGDMITNDEGKYQFSTMKPGSYPNSRVPSHVHYVVSAPGYAEQLFELRFIGDPFLSNRILARDRRKGRFNSIKDLVKDENGILQCVFNIKLEK